MKIAVLAIGTRGDVQPNIALAKALQARGHDVVLGAPDNFKQWVESHGLKFHALGVDMQSLLQSPEGREIISGNVFAIMKIWKETLVPMMRQSLDATWEAARDADVIVYHPKVVAAPEICEKTGAKPVFAAALPLFSTGAFPFMAFTVNLGPWLNRQTYRILYLTRLTILGILNKWRREVLGLGKGPLFATVGEYSGGLAPRLCAVSNAVLPRPDDMDDGFHMTGYWFLDEGTTWQPDEKLAAFLEAGEPPVYIGFGSLTTKNPKQLGEEILEGVRRAGVRALLATGWGGIEETDLPENVHMIESAPHDALFKRVSAVVHHGGAGSTGAGLRAGLPTLVCYMAVDQPFWGNRVYKLGCGPEPLSLKRLKAESFASALRALVTKSSYRERAEEVARGIAAEDGIMRAIEVIEAQERRDAETLDSGS